MAERPPTDRDPPAIPANPKVGGLTGGASQLDHDGAQLADGARRHDQAARSAPGAGLLPAPPSTGAKVDLSGTAVGSAPDR
jgi:hypothetical protein